jgi:hypothetical protein
MAWLMGGYSMSESGDTFERLSALFQGLAICDLLTKANVDGFRENLVRSGHCRRSYLRRSSAEGNHDGPNLALSRTEAFLDCLAAGDLALAQDIATISPVDWNPDWEYEEDHYYYRFLQQLVGLTDTSGNGALLEFAARIEAALEGAKWPQLDVVRALINRDEQAFTDALEAVLLDETRRFDEKRPAVVASKFLFWPRSFVSIQGLALLRAAELVGLDIADDFPMCPSDGRVPVSPTLYRDLFREMEDGLARMRTSSEG